MKQSIFWNSFIYTATLKHKEKEETFFRNFTQYNRVCTTKYLEICF